MQNISTVLTAWYDKNHRNFPWRIAPNEIAQGILPNTYHVWLSEIMLQQTTVEAVKPYFYKFLQNWPDIFALASASEEDILKAWAGLGYYARARNLKKCATQIITQYNGVFPNNYKVLKKLAGIGDYTAAAISAIAFGQTIAVVDANVERVISRLFAIITPLNKAKAVIKQKTQNITPNQRPGDFAQAMMDLGAMICTIRKPKCTICPLKNFCQANAQNNAEAYPIKAIKTVKKTRKGAAFIIVNQNGQIYLEKRANKGLLASMTQIPNQFEEQGDISTKLAPFKADWQYCGHIEHIFTHFALTLHIYMTKSHKNTLNNDKTYVGNGWWCPIDKLYEEALPTVMKKAIQAAFPKIF